MIYNLLYPLTDNDGEVYDELTLKRPTVKDMKALDSVTGDIEKIAVLIQKVARSKKGSEVPSYLVDKMDAEDFGALGEMVSSFFEKSPQTGEK